MNYCLADGSFLLTPAELQPSAETPTIKISDAATEVLPNAPSGAPTEVLPAARETQRSGAKPEPESVVTQEVRRDKYHPQFLIAGVLVIGLFVGVTLLGIYLIGSFNSSADNGSKTGSTANTSRKTTNSSYPATKSPQSDSDAALQSTLEFRLKTDSEIKYANILVAVKDGGNVTLSGSVETVGQKIRAEVVAKGVKGVKNVENLIDVEP